jgi:asparagine synthase (glutamine-hydrolysing)
MQREWLWRGSQHLPMFWGGAEAFSTEGKRRVLSPRLREKFKGATSWDVIAPIHQRFLDHAPDPSPLNWMTYLDLQMRLPELLLMRVDKMTMAVGLESRVPFLDHKVIEFAARIPSGMKIKGGQLKQILKKAVAPVLPEQILNRKKQGFGLPIQEWFIQKLGPRVKSDLQEFMEQTDLLDHDEVDRLIREGRATRAWCLLNLALWWKHFIAR